MTGKKSESSAVRRGPMAVPAGPGTDCRMVRARSRAPTDPALKCRTTGYPAAENPPMASASRLAISNGSLSSIDSPRGRSLLIQHLAHLACEPCRRERLLNERRARVQHAVSLDRFVGVTRHVQHPRLGALLGEPVHQLATAHFGHHDVRDEEVDG